jgi:hypothetical protein
MNPEARKRYKDIDLPFICPLTNNEFNTIKGLACYLTRVLKINHKEYYDMYVNHRDKECYFCGNEGIFIGVGKGYRNLCSDTECVKKSFKSNSVDGIRYRKNCSLEEAEELFKEINKDTLEKRTNTRSKILETNPNFHRENSRNCKEYYIKRGMTEEEANANVEMVMKEIHTKSTLKKANNKEKYRDSYNTTLEYYIKRGMTEEEANVALSNRQSTFSKEKCISELGEKLGREKWQNRQEKWQNTLGLKTDEEKKEINLKKMFNKSGYSKISQKLFWDIYNLFQNNNVKFEELNAEIVKYDKTNSRCYKYDYVDCTIKKVIEFNGDFWHCNPNKYKQDYLHMIMNKTAKEIWEKDEIKKNLMINDGYEVLVIWEGDYRKSPELVLEQCIEFLKK